MKRRATEVYSSLSEFCHPNCDAFINHSEWETDVWDVQKLSFGRPSRNLLTLCLPAANTAVVSFLHSMRDLIAPIGDRELAETIHKLIVELLEHAEPTFRGT